jgi:hypothetical protein
MNKSLRLGAAASVVLLGGCMNLNIGMMPGRDASACASCDEEARRAEYLEQIRRSGFLATRDDALTTAGPVLSTELK